MKLPWELALAYFPHIRGREFSVATGERKEGEELKGTKIELLVAIVKYQTVLKKVSLSYFSSI